MGQQRGQYQQRGPSAADVALMRSTAEAEGFPVENASVYVQVISGRALITKAGLEFKMNAQYPDGWAVQAHMPSEAEFEMVKEMMGFGRGELAQRVCVMRGEVYVEGRTEPFTDWGTTTVENLTGFTAKYPLEMAATRAKNRAMRAAVNTGLTSAEEVMGGPNTGGQTQQRRHSPPAEEHPGMVPPGAPVEERRQPPPNANGTGASADEIEKLRLRLENEYEAGKISEQIFERGCAMLDSENVTQAQIAGTHARLDSIIGSGEKG